MALEMAKTIPFDEQKIAARCLTIVERPDEEPSKYQQALSWAEDLPSDSLRTKTLIGAAQYRLGRIDQALQTVSQHGGTDAPEGSDRNLWEQRRRAVEVLCLQQHDVDTMNTHRQAIALADFVHDSFDATEPNMTWSPLTNEALRSQGEWFRIKQMTARPRPTTQVQSSAENQPQQDTWSDRMHEIFQRFDRNRDGVISDDEFEGTNFLSNLSRFDRDQTPGLSLAEYTVSFLINRAEAEARKLSRSAVQNAYDRFDQNHDDLVTAAEMGDAWSRYRHSDQDQDDALSFTEFLDFAKTNTFASSLVSSLMGAQAPEPAVRLLALNFSLETGPAHMSLLNARAWLLATSDDDGLRDGKQAVRDALAACELRDYRIPTVIDTLAAAYAEVGEFDMAIQHASQAASMSGQTELAKLIGLRLQLYRQNLPFRQSLRLAVESNQRSGLPEPLFSSEQVAMARHIRGGEPCWSADGKQLIYALTGFAAEHSYFESIDLATGETKVLCAAGQRPVCSPIDGTIAFERQLSTDSPQVWLFDPNSNESRSLVDGMIPSWTHDGKLCYVALTRPGTQLRCVDPVHPDNILWSRTGNFGTFLWALSPDHQRIACSSFGKWRMLSPEAAEQIGTFDIGTEDKGRADWSPDGRWIAYNAKIDRIDGVWLLDPESTETRLLVSIPAYPRWSPDGKSLALGLRSSNDIVLLDVSSLDALWKENQAEPAKQP
jgi:Ca2+-binding EF-hand superfamily protein